MIVEEDIRKQLQPGGNNNCQGTARGTVEKRAHARYLTYACVGTFYKLGSYKKNTKVTNITENKSTNNRKKGRKCYWKLYFYPRFLETDMGWVCVGEGQD